MRSCFDNLVFVGVRDYVLYGVKIDLWNDIKNEIWYDLSDNYFFHIKMCLENELNENEKII